MAAHTKFTPAIGDSICKLVSLGVSLEAAAESEGVCRRTVYNWRDAGRSGKRLYVKFADDLEAAFGKAEVAQTLNVIKAGSHDWRSSAWWLEKRRPDLYGHRSRDDVPAEGADGKADVQFYLPDNGRRPHK